MAEASAPDAARDLLAAATHFAERDWNYTRLNKIVHIRYDDDFKGYDHPARRLKRAAKELVRVRRSRMHRMFDTGVRTSWPVRVRNDLLGRAAMIRVYLRTADHSPDGVLDGGGVITHWEETGEYLQMVQPSVGELLATFLLAEPTNPHAVAITAELTRIRDGYTARIVAGEVDGKPRVACPVPHI